MRIISRKRLVEFWQTHTDTEQPLRAWYAEGQKATWHSPAEIKSIYWNVSVLAHNRAVFNIKGNIYRLVVMMNFKQSKIIVRSIGLHQ